MHRLTVTRDTQTFRFYGRLHNLIVQAGEFDTASIVDPDGYEVYALSFPYMLVKQAM